MSKNFDDLRLPRAFHIPLPLFVPLLHPLPLTFQLIFAFLFPSLIPSLTLFFFPFSPSFTLIFPFYFSSNFPVHFSSRFPSQFFSSFLFHFFLQFPSTSLFVIFLLPIRKGKERRKIQVKSGREEAMNCEVFRMQIRSFNTWTKDQYKQLSTQVFIFLREIKQKHAHRYFRESKCHRISKCLMLTLLMARPVSSVSRMRRGRPPLGCLHGL